MDKRVYDVAGVRDVTGMAPPMVMLDVATVSGDGGSGSGIKNVAANEPCFVGHFPGHPILPGVLQVEAMAQLTQLAAGAGTAITGCERVKFRNPVVPGDRMQVETELTEDRLGAKARTVVAGRTCAEARLALGPMPAAPAATMADAIAAPAEGMTVLDCEAIMAAIPHRYPFLLVDRVWYDPAVPPEALTVHAVKNLTLNDPALSCRTAMAPLLPVTLLPEMCAQACCAQALSQPERSGALAYFMAIDTATFHRPATAGDQLEIAVEPRVVKERFGTAAGRVSVGGELVMECAIKFAFVRS